MHFSYLLLKESAANDVINVSSFAGPICCEPRHRRMIAAVKITMSKWQHCKFDDWRKLSVLFCCESK